VLLLLVLLLHMLLLLLLLGLRVQRLLLLGWVQQQAQVRDVQVI
jgi:hypothetical protein